MIVVLGIVIVVGAGLGFALEWTGKHGAASFTGLATMAIGVLCPSPLRSGPPKDGNQDGSAGGGQAPTPPGNAAPGA